MDKIESLKWDLKNAEKEGCEWKARESKIRLEKYEKELAEAKRGRAEEEEKERLRKEEEKKLNAEDEEKEAIKCIRKHNINYLYRIESIDNLSSVLEHGLLSYNRIHELGILNKDISDELVQERRHKKRDSIYNRPVHDYVPLYFSPKNIMLWVRKEMQKDIVFLGIDPQVLLESTTIFSDGNAASYDTKFYTGTEMLDKLP